MDRKEILTSLELTADVTDLQIKQKLEEKIQYYEELSKNSPSAFLRRLNGMHLSNLVLVKKELTGILQQSVPVAAVQTDKTNNELQAESTISQTIPVILSSSMKKSVKKEPETKKIPAYLIRHTENKPIKSFPLSDGKNYIGRRPHATLEHFIALEDDEFVSRIHAMIYIDAMEENNSYIDDSVSSNEGRVSRNGTFVNGNKKRILSKTSLKNNDVIQAGETKFIYRLNTMDLDEILKETEDRDYMHTIVIRL